MGTTAMMPRLPRSGVRAAGLGVAAAGAVLTAVSIPPRLAQLRTPCVAEPCGLGQLTAEGTARLADQGLSPAGDSALAARTLARFTSRLRSEVDLDTLTGELLGVVEHTMQPERVSVWLRRD